MHAGPSASLRPRLLTVSPYRSYPAHAGGRRRVHFLNRGISRAGWEVFLHSVAPITPQELVDPALTRHDIHYTEYAYRNPTIPLVNRLLKQVGAEQMAASILPRMLLPLPELRKRLRQADAIMFEHPHAFDFVLPDWMADKTVILDAHNIEAAMPMLASNGVARRMIGTLEDCEARAMLRADLILFCTSSDRDDAVARYGIAPEKGMVATNGSEAAGAIPTAEERAKTKIALGLPDGPVAIFSGSAWQPNIESAEAIRALAPSCPDWTFLIVGKVGDALSGPLPGNLRVTGYVKDIAPYLAASDIGLNLMSSGGGSNIKMFDYLASGLPVVSTPFGERGLERTDEAAILTAEGQEISRLLADLAAERAGLGLQGRWEAAAELSRYYEWDHIARRVADRIGEVMGSAAIAVVR